MRGWPWGRPRRVERSIAKVGRPGAAPDGLGFAIDRRHVVTCAHVVNQALGRDPRDVSAPPDPHRLQLDFQIGADGDHDDLPTRYGKVAVWGPVEGKRFECRDIAVLALGERLPANLVVRRLGFDQTTGTVAIYGPEASRTHGIHVRGELLGEVERHLMHVDQHLTGVFEVAPGFSGGPVWQPDTGVVIGMLQARGVGGARAGDIYVLASELIDCAHGKSRRTDDRADPPRAWEWARHHCLVGMSLAGGLVGFGLYGGIERLDGWLHVVPFRQAGYLTALMVGVAVAAVIHATALVGALVADRGGAKRAPTP
jgi:Trypsin-like peptidase domain